MCSTIKLLMIFFALAIVCPGVGGVCLGSTPLMFITDYYGRTVKSVSSITGAVTTVAGVNNIAGTTDGIGTNALFSAPQGVAFSSDGSVLYIADYSSIRSMSTTTFAVQTLYYLSYTNGYLTEYLTVSADGLNVYFTSYYYLFKLNIPTNTGSKIVGSGATACKYGIGLAANMYYATGVYASRTGSFLLISSGLHSIDKVDLSTMALSSFAGLCGTSAYTNGVGSSARFSYPGTIVMTADESVMFVLDQSQTIIRKITYPGASVTTLVSIPTLYPYSLTISPDSAFLFITCNNPINKIYKLTISSAAYVAFSGSGVTGSVDGSSTTAKFTPWGISEYKCTCPIGQYGTATCSSCPVGTYGDYSGVPTVSGCKSCPAGKYNPSTGSSSSGDCLTCPAGTYSPSTSSAGCTACLAGKYNPNTGSSSSADCLACLAGAYNPSTGSSSSGDCLTCPAGTYSPSTSSAGCTACLAGKYNPNTGSSSSADCLVCGYGFQSLDGASVCTPCSSIPVCQNGEFLSGCACTPCTN